MKKLTVIIVLATSHFIGCRSPRAPNSNACRACCASRNCQVRQSCNCSLQSPSTSVCQPNCLPAGSAPIAVPPTQSPLGKPVSVQSSPAQLQNGIGSQTEIRSADPSAPINVPDPAAVESQAPAPDSSRKDVPKSEPVFTEPVPSFKRAPKDDEEELQLPIPVIDRIRQRN